MNLSCRVGRQDDADVLRVGRGVLADLVREPELRAVRFRRVVLVAGVDAHVVDREAPVAAALVRLAPEPRLGLGLQQAHLLHLDRLDVAVRGEAGRHGAVLVVIVGRHRGHRHDRRGHDEVGLADGPHAGLRKHQRRGQIGRIAARGAVVGPGRQGGDLRVAQRDVVLVVLDADGLVDEPRRHLAQRGPVPDRAGPGTRLLVREERHRRHRVRPMAVLAGALQDGRDVPRERHLRAGLGRARRRRGQPGGYEQRTDEQHLHGTRDDR